MNIEQKRNIPVEAFEEDDQILPLGELLQTIWRRLWVILFTSILLVGAAIGFSLLQTPSYEASVKILVGQQQRSSSEALGSEIAGLQQLTQTMAEAVGTRPIAEAVIEQQKLRISPEEFLDENLNVEQISSTQFIEVSYRDRDPKKAKDIANSIGKVFSEQISEISPSANAITATVWEQAAVPEDPVSPNLPLNGLVALAMGLLLGVGLACLLEYLDDSWHSAEEAEKISGVPNFGMIPKFKLIKSKKVAETK